MYTPKGELNEELLKLCTETDFLQKEIGDAGLSTPEACYEAARRHLPDISFEEFTESMGVMNQYMTELRDGLLTEEELNEVAGGKSLKSTLAITIPSSVAATAIIYTLIYVASL